MTFHFPFPSVARPMAIPATGALIGTPASMSASVAPHVDPIELDPFEPKTSETARIVYGNVSLSGSIG